jgi:hypothetical protein
MEDRTQLIGNLKLKFADVNVFYHPECGNDNVHVAWQMRNPETCYTGIVYMNNETGQIAYPEDAVIPEQTEKDREIIPKFIIVGQTTLTEELEKKIRSHVELDYLKRN